jgi:hypothetical protein
MATPIPTPNYIIIWLDQYFGLMGTHEQFKCSLNEQTNPNSNFPTPPEPSEIDRLIQSHAMLQRSFENVPQNLKVFAEPLACLQCINQSLQERKKIFFITSGSMGGIIAQDIINKYSSLKTIYVFCGYYQAHVGWANDCLDNDIYCIMLNHQTDLLVRLLRDVAEYFIGEGDGELNRDETLAYSAISYFKWAELLLERANNFATARIDNRLQYVVGRIEFAEGKIEQQENFQQ